MTIGEDLIEHLNDDGDVVALVSDRISQGVVNEDETHPRIWLGRASRNHDLDCGGVGGIIEDNFDLEIVAEHDADTDGIEQALKIAEAVRDSLHGFTGEMGVTTVLGCFVDDQSDDYLYKSIDSPDGLYMSALNVRILHST